MLGYCQCLFIFVIWALSEIIICLNPRCICALASTVVHELVLVSDRKQTRRVLVFHPGPLALLGAKSEVVVQSSNMAAWMAFSQMGPENLLYPMEEIWFGNHMTS